MKMDKHYLIITFFIMIAIVIHTGISMPLDETSSGTYKGAMEAEDSEETNWNNHIARLIETVDEKYYRWFLRDQKPEDSISTTLGRRVETDIPLIN